MKGYWAIPVIVTMILVLSSGFAPVYAAIPEPCELVIKGTWSIDFESCSIGGIGPPRDLFWEQVTESKRYLVPINGVEIANLGTIGMTGFNGLDDPRGYSYSNNRIDGSTTSNTIPTNTVLLIHTYEGNYAKMIITNYDYNLSVAISLFSKTVDPPKEAMAEEGEIMVSIETGTAGQGDMMTIDVSFTNMDGSGTEHVNYDIMATQGTEVVLDEKGVHDHDGVMTHTTMALPMDASSTMPVNVEVTFNGFGIDPPFTGPAGQVATKQVVPEFGTIAMMILGVAIVSLIAISVKSRIIPKL